MNRFKSFKSSYLDCFAIRYGIGPRIRSIIAKCSLLSCV
jgi:hypothetical protein